MSDETPVVVDTPAETPVVETKSADDQALDAFSKGAEAVADGPRGTEKPADKPAEAVADGGVPTGAKAAAEPTPEEKAAAEQKASDDAEIKKLGIKNETTAARFRELNAEARKVPELTKQVEELAPLAQEAKQYMAIVQDVGAKPEQIGQMFKYLKAINSGDPAAMNAAADTLLNEAKALFKYLGRELPAFDPVADHADLKQALEAGGVTPELARETARTRAQQTATDLRQRQEDEQRRADEQENNVKIAAINSLNELGAKLQVSDPHFRAKWDAMNKAGTTDTIKEDVHPSRWLEAFKRAYAKIPDPAPKPPVGAMPLRPTGSDPGAQQRVPKNDSDAFEIGVERARAAGM